MERVFLFKDVSDNGRDCCAYIVNEPMRFECGHYFGSVNLEGSCYSGSDWRPYCDIKTVLTEDEYRALKKFSKEISKLGYGITVGDERYEKGVQLCKDIQYVYDRLNSEDNEKLFEEIQNEEVEWLMEEYSLDEEDIEAIFNEYALEYRDRSIVGCVFKDTAELGYEEAWELGYIKNGDTIAEKYFDTDRFGEDLLEESHYIQLEDGRVVSLNY